MKPFVLLLLGVLFTPFVQAQAILYLSSGAGYMLHRSGNTAVTANWRGQAPISGFAGYGAIRMDNQCLTGKSGNQPLQWETCRRGDKAQTWGYSNGRLNNELGWCADVEGNRNGAGVRVMAWSCSGASNQRWKAHRPVSLQSVLAQVRDPSTRQAIEAGARSARPGQPLPLTPAQQQQLPASLIQATGGSLIGLDGATLISAGGLN